tara:strand:+ start:341 stop:613 length:273 start_codon:yes stop_codon:yes gene_type:complete
MKASILKAINSISSMEEMNDVIELIKLKQKSLKTEVRVKTRFSIKVGSNVIVESRDGDIKGVIVKVNRTKAIVDMNGSNWNVPLTMIKAA